MYMFKQNSLDVCYTLSHFAVNGNTFTALSVCDKRGVK